MCSLICRAKYYSSGIQGPCLPGRATPPAFLKEQETEENNSGYMQSCSGCDQAEAHELTRGQTHAHAHATYQGAQARAGHDHQSLYYPCQTEAWQFHVTKNWQQILSQWSAQKLRICIIDIAICNNSSSQATVSKTFNWHLTRFSQYLCSD